MVEKTKYRHVAVPHTSSYFANNLSGNPDGKAFVTVKNTEKGALLLIYGNDIVDKSTDFGTPYSALLPDLDIH